MTGKFNGLMFPLSHFPYPPVYLPSVLLYMFPAHLHPLHHPILLLITYSCLLTPPLSPSSIFGLPLSLILLPLPFSIILLPHCSPSPKLPCTSLPIFLSSIQFQSRNPVLF